MNRLSRLTLVFAVVFAVLILTPAFLSSQFGPFPLMKVGDVTDLLTPIILLPIYWLLFCLDGSEPISLRAVIMFMVFAAFWAEGQGMHLSANAIGHLLEGATTQDAVQLTHVYDEIVGHYLWHIGVIGLSAVLLYRQWGHGVAERLALRWEGVAGFVYGATFFLMTVEGGTVPIGLPYAAIIAIFGFTAGRKRLRAQPILAFFVIAHILALLFYAGWGLYWRGFPQFSDVGLLK